MRRVRDEPGGASAGREEHERATKESGAGEAREGTEQQDGRGGLGRAADSSASRTPTVNENAAA